MGKEYYLLPWSEIETISDHCLPSGQSYFLIFLKDIDRLLATGKIRKTFGFNTARKIYGTPYMFMSKTFKVSHSEMKKLFMQYLEAYARGD